MFPQTLRYSFNRGNSNSEILYRSVCDAKTFNDQTEYTWISPIHVSTPYNRFIPTISQNYCDIVNIVHFAPLLNMRRCIVWYYWVWCWRYIYLHTCIFLLFKQLTAELKNLSLVSNKYTGYGFDPIVRHNYISSWNVRLLSYVLCMWTSTEWLKHEESIFKSLLVLIMHEVITNIITFGVWYRLLIMVLVSILLSRNAIQLIRNYTGSVNEVVKVQMCINYRYYNSSYNLGILVGLYIWRGISVKIIDFSDRWIRF